MTPDAPATRSERHVRLLRLRALSASSASTAAMMAWMGIRPLAISWPPARRMAEANGAAHMFS